MIWMLAAALAAEPFAVVELFTSEGCSSCPPADQVLAELARDAHQDDLSVYALSFHVDYWNRLGWTDPWSDPAWTARQRAYSAAFSTRGLYTPQAVVNGQHELVGSRRTEVKALVAQALTEKPTVPLSIQTASSKGTITVTVETDDDAPVTVVLAQHSTTSEVARGENTGKTLTHVHVVRGLSTRTGPGEVTLTLPDDMTEASAEVIALVQGDDMAITAATSVRLAPS